MAIVRSNKYNDPAIGAIFENIAQMFAPAPASDVAAYATAEERRAAAESERQSAARLKALDDYARSPDFNKDTWDRMAVAADRGTIANGYHGVDSAAATEVQKTLLAPVAEGATRFVLPTLASQLGLPEIQSGNIKVAPGEQVTTADGRLINGAPKPLSETEVKGNLLADQASAMSSDQLTALIMGTTPVENIVGPDGKTPQTVYRTQAVGQQPYFNKGAEAKGELYNYVAPTGEEGTAVFDGANIVDAITKQPLPEGVKVYKASAQGTTDQIGMGTNSNRTDAQRLRASVSNADALVNQLEQIVVDHPAATGLAGNVMSFVQDSGQVIKELTTTFGDGPITPDQMRSVTEKIDQVTGGKYEPAYRQANALILELAYANASMNNPSGEVSMQALAREVDALGQGMMGNDQGLLGVLSITRDRMKRKLVQADVLDGTTAAPTPDQIGQPTNEPARPVSEADYNALPSGALFVDPEDGQTYRKP